MDIPSMRTWIDDEVVTPEMMNEQVRDASLFNLTRPGCYLTIPNSFNATLSGTYNPTFNTVKYDTDDMADFVNQPHGFIVNTTGLYLVAFQFEVSVSGASNNRGNFWMTRTGSQSNRIGQFQFTGSFTTAVAGSVSGFEYLVAGDAVQANLLISGGGSATLGADTPISIGAIWLGT